MAPGPSRREVFAGGVSMRFAVPVRDSSDSPRAVADGNLGLAFGGRGDGWDAAWNGVNVRYARDRAGDDLTLASGFSFALEAGGQRAAYGDVTVQETALVAPSFARRGVVAEFRGWRTEFHVFRVSAVAVSGWESGLGSSGGEISGVSVQRSLLSDGRLPVTVVYAAGENRGVDGVDSAGGLAPSRGDVLGLAASFRVLGVEVRGEMAYSRFDPDTRDGKGRDRDLAVETGVSASPGPLELGAGYHRYGTDFASIANPTLTPDREGLTGRLAVPWGAARAVPPVQVDVTLKGTGATTAGPLTLTRVEMAFQNGRADLTVNQNDPVTARATVNYAGNGVLHVQWLVDGRVVQQTVRTLTYGDTVTLETGDVPPLPTFEPGEHRLTLRVLSPAVAFAIPELRYVVLAGGRAGGGAGGIRWFLPLDGAVLYPDQVRFS